MNGGRSDKRRDFNVACGGTVLPPIRFRRT
jgi:hypothetical protein